jgi:hypothetical protein
MSLVDKARSLVGPDQVTLDVELTLRKVDALAIQQGGRITSRQIVAVAVVFAQELEKLKNGISD